MRSALLRETEWLMPDNGEIRTAEAASFADLSAP
jgi:hypothetical protein